MAARFMNGTVVEPGGAEGGNRFSSVWRDMYRDIPVANLVCASSDRTTAVDDLVADISERGLLQPLCVRPLSGGMFEVYAGKRRLEALRRLSEPVAACHVQDIGSDVDALIRSLSENLLRSQLSEADKCSAAHALMKKGVAAESVGKGLRPYLRMRERLHADMQEQLDSGALSVESALALSKNVPQEEQGNVLKETGGEPMAIRQKKPPPVKSQPWVYDEDGKTPVPIPPALYDQVLRIVRSI